MEKTEVMSILVECMTVNDVTIHAVVMAYGEIGSRILKRLVGDSIRSKFWEALLLVHKTKGEYIIFTTLKDSGTENLRNDVQHFVAFHGHLLKIITFLCENYDELLFVDAVRELYPKQKLEETRAIVEKNHRSRIERMIEEELDGLLEHIDVTNELFDLAYFVILGEERYKIFRDEFNQATSFLDRFQKDIIATDSIS